VVDVFDALTSERPYRAAWPAEKALAHIREQSGKHFDPRVVDAFLANDFIWRPQVSNQP
jgi:HD-GYP domain-containing protein (c-di-GMP phosphodiesterase class II)